MNSVLVILGLILLVLGGNWLLKASVALSLKLEIPKIIIGMTVVSLATSAPELIVSVNAALNGAPDLSLGNVIGSNIANLGLVLGITLLFGHIKVEKGFYKNDWPILMIASLLLYVFLWNDQIIDRTEGIVFLVFLAVFLIYLLRFQKAAVFDELPEDDEAMPLYKVALFLLIGGLGLWGGSELLVNGATALAIQFGVTERVIAVSVVSIGTSIPELAASIIAILKKEKAISIGNLIGSNIFNILAVLGFTSIITPIPVVDDRFLSFDIYYMLAISFIILPLVFIPKGSRLDWKDGIILLGTYVFFIYSAFH